MTQYHRIRHYPDRFSNFDIIEKCEKPARCMGCEYMHPACDESGSVIAMDHPLSAETQE